MTRQALRMWRLCMCLMSVLLVGQAWGQAKPNPPQTPADAKAADRAPETWADQLEALSRWATEKRTPKCESMCFFLSRMVLRGSVADRALTFELDGGVLTDHPVAVPLFGPAGKVRVDEVLEDGKKAAVGFDKEQYFLWTGAKRFVLKGKLALEGDLALTIPGPLNTLEADLSAGRMVEGTKLAGLHGSTVHFDIASTTEPKTKEPTVFQLSRAIRVGREITFEYRLVMRSGSDLGVVRLALRLGEKVLDVVGSAGWRVDGSELVLPTAGTSAEIKVIGTLAQVTSLSADDRSAYEWWLFESDPEHRLTMKGDARQLDVAESPIPRTQANARLYMASRGQKLDVTVTTLAARDVLAAVVREHNRMVVVTRRGDVVADDQFSYENNGIDYLTFQPEGRPIYLATDDKSERIMHVDKGRDEMMIPLRVGSHRVHAQAISQKIYAPLVGAMELPVPQYPLTASRTNVTIGFPAHVRPLLVLGGDNPESAFGYGDLAALVASLISSIALLRTWGRRALGVVTLMGFWAFTPLLFVVLMVGIACVGGDWLIRRLLTGKAVQLVRAMAIGVSLLAGFVLFVGTFAARSKPMSSEPRWERPASTGAKAETDAVGNRDGDMPVQSSAGGIVEGVTPVALQLPAYENSVTVYRELVTKERPFRPVVWYATQWLLGGMGVVWLGCAVWLAAAHREELARAVRSVRAKLAAGPAKEKQKAEATEATDQAQPPTE